MTTQQDHEQRTAERVSAVLHGLPPRRAPAHLASRVQAELAQQAARAGWRRGFAHWPTAARIIFLALSPVLTAIVLYALPFVLAGLHATAPLLSPSGPLLRDALATLVGTLGLFSALGRDVPTQWLYGGLVLIAGLYVCLFALSATAYRALLAPTSATGDV